jgi:hypothetical protein
LVLTAGFWVAAWTPAQEESAPVRLANGYVIEGKVQQATREGLVVQTPKGSVTYPWKYLSAGTRNRYEAAAKAAPPAKSGGK